VFADVADVASLNLTPDEAEARIASATAAIRGVCGWSVTEETVNATAPWSRTLFLPTLHLTSLSVSVNSTPLSSGADYAWQTNGVVSLFLGRLPAINGGWSGATLNLSYTHGYETVPDGIRAVCLDLVAEAVNPQRALTGATVDGVTVTYQKETSSVFTNLEDDWRLVPYICPVAR